jgi:YaiO family outer membrane protein
MKRTLLLVVLLWAAAESTPCQTGDSSAAAQAVQTAQQTSQADRQEPWLIELGAFDNFLTDDYGRWTGVQGRVMYRGLKHFAPIFGAAYQHRDYGSQTTLGLDSYILVNKWFYAIAGGGYSPEGSAELWPRWRCGAMGLFTIPNPKGLLGTVGYSEIHGQPGTYGRIISVGGMYYRGKAIWSGNVSFNRTYPGSVDSKSAGIALQYGAEKDYWLAVGFNGGRIAYQMFTVQPLPVEWISYGPNFFYQKWLTRKFGFIVRCDYQNQREAFHRVGIAGSLFFEVP